MDETQYCSMCGRYKGSDTCLICAITLDDNEGWAYPLSPPFHKTEHYFIRIEGSMYSLSLCGKYNNYSFQFFNPHKTKEDLELIYEIFNVCEICNELLKKRMRTSTLEAFFK